MVRVISVVLFLVLAPLVGGLLDGLDRKISARMQGRIGPPLLQPFYDVAKLWNKQMIVVNKAQTFLLLSYCATQIFTGCMFYAGVDVMMCFFVLSTGATFLVFAGFITDSPYSSLGASRELIQMMSYEPAILLTCVGFYLATGTFNVDEIIETPFSPILLLLRLLADHQDAQVALRYQHLPPSPPGAGQGTDYRDGRGEPGGLHDYRVV